MGCLVDLDFEHNVRPAPAQTVEVLASLEEFIKSRIIEDGNKSKRGLAEVYEAEYVQKANPAFTPLPQSDELKKEVMSIQTNVPAIAMEEVICKFDDKLKYDDAECYENGRR